MWPEETSTSLTASPTIPNRLGRHLLAEFYDCNPNVLNNNALVEQLMKEAAVACGATIVSSCFHHFSPYGVSGVVVIAESHLTIHTWPEHGYAAVDLYTCGEACDPAVAFAYLNTAFSSGHATYVPFSRGLKCAQTDELLKLPPQAFGEPMVFTKKEDKPSITTSAALPENPHAPVAAAVMDVLSVESTPL